MNDIEVLIEQLAAHAGPVKRLSSPMRRTLVWLALASATVGGIVAAHGLRPDLLEAMSVPGAAIEWIASVLTGALAAFAVFQISVPGRSPSWAWLPFPAAALWVAGMGLGCLHDIKQTGAVAFAFELSGVECTRAIALISVPLGLVLLVMVRHAGVVRPGPTAMLTALSAAALSAAGVSLIHQGESALMLLLWHAGGVVLVSLASWLLGRQLFSWIGYPVR